MIEIRTFIIDDYNAVFNLWKEANLIIKKSDELDEIKKKIERDPDLFLVATENNEIVGVVLGAWDGRRGWINHLAVKENKRYNGIATSLVNELEIRLKEKGCLKINLLIQPNNIVVAEFYKKLNFNTEKVLFMSKEL